MAVDGSSGSSSGVNGQLRESSDVHVFDWTRVQNGLQALDRDQRAAYLTFLLRRLTILHLAELGRG